MLAELAVTRPAPPAEPEGVQLVSATGSAMRLRWEAPACHGASVTSYQVDRARGEQQGAQLPSSSTSAGDLSAAAREGSTRSLETMEAEYSLAGGAGLSEVDAAELASTVSSLEDGQSRSHESGPASKKGKRGQGKARDRAATWQTVHSGADPCCEVKGSALLSIEQAAPLQGLSLGAAEQACSTCAWRWAAQYNRPCRIPAVVTRHACM